MVETYTVETVTGNTLPIVIDRDAREILFLGVGGQRVRTFSFTSFACRTGGINLELYGIVLDAATVAEIKQWAGLGIIVR